MALIMMVAGRGLAAGVPAPPRLRPHAVVRQAACPRLLWRYRHIQTQARALQRHNTENSNKIFPEKYCAASVPISTFMCL